MKKKIMLGALLILLSFGVTGCVFDKNEDTTSNNDGNTTSTTTTSSSNIKLSSSEIFTSRDLEQTVDTSNATELEVVSDENITISKEGVYVIVGNASNTTIVVDAEDAKVDLVLDNVTIGNYDTPAIYVKNADKVFISLVGSNKLSASSSFSGDTDSVIYSNNDIVIKGKGSLTIDSSAKGISSKDDLLITGGTLNIVSKDNALDSRNSIGVSSGTFTIKSSKDALHSEYSEDDTKGLIYITGGTFNINASDDGIHATTLAQIDGGSITIDAEEGIEATIILINNGDISIKASDDGINGSAKSKSYSILIEINGGNITIEMAEGDTDAIDSNGDIYVNGGTINITGQSAFDWDGNAKMTGGNVTVNGSSVTELTNQFAGGGPGGPNGGRR